MRSKRRTGLAYVEYLKNVAVANHLVSCQNELVSSDVCHLRYKATVSARHSSIDDDTSPSTDPGVCPGLYHEVLRKVSDDQEHDGSTLTSASLSGD